MMDVPPPITAWTFDTVETIVRQHEREPGLYDYKTVLNPARTDGKHAAEHLASIRRTACSMGNAYGGYILFGVQDRAEREHLDDPLECIMGISVHDDHAKQFQEKTSVIQPDLYFEPTSTIIHLPVESERGVFVVHIPRSPRRPHMDESTGICYRRGSGGSNEKMKIHEVREQMINTEERLRKVTLLRLLIKQYRAVYNDMAKQLNEISKTLVRFDTTAYMPILADVWHLLPSDDINNRLLLEIPQVANRINRTVDILLTRWQVTGNQPPDAFTDLGARN